MVAHASNSSTQKVEAGESDIKVYNEFGTRRGYMRPSFKKLLTYKYNPLLGIEVIIQV